MQKSNTEGLRIHASIRPEPASKADAAPSQPRRRKWPASHMMFRRSRTSQKLSFGDRLLRNTSIACALLLGILTVQNIDQPWSRLALDGIESALTMKIDLDESLGKLSFVRELVPESALVFLDISAQDAFAPVEGTITHSYSETQPWIGYQCAPSAEVRALEPATVSAVTQLSDGDWGILLDHGAGIESVYAYLDEVSVAAGDSVSAGDILGKASSEADASIYFELRKDGKAMDPSERFDL